MENEKSEFNLSKEAMYLPENIAHVREAFAERLEDRATNPESVTAEPELFDLAQKVRAGTLIPFSKRIEEIYLGLSFDGTVKNYVGEREMHSIRYRKLFFIDFIGLGNFGSAKDARPALK